MNNDINQLLKVNTLEAQVLELSKTLDKCALKIDNLTQELLDHMKEEDLERRATDRKLNLHTILLVAVGFGTVSGADILKLISVAI